MQHEPQQAWRMPVQGVGSSAEMVRNRIAAGDILVKRLDYIAAEKIVQGTSTRPSRPVDGQGIEVRVVKEAANLGMRMQKARPRRG